MHHRDTQKVIPVPKILNICTKETRPTKVEKRSWHTFDEIFEEPMIFKMGCLSCLGASP
jgi:hypothetical protein